MESTTRCGISRRNAMSITVKLVSFLSDAKTIELRGMKSYDTVWHVKLLIDMKERIIPSQQILIHNGTELEDHKTLAANNVENGSITYLFVGRTVHPIPPNPSASKMTVKMSGRKPVTMEVQPWYTARHVKAFMQSLTGLVSLDKFALKHGGKLLYNDDFVDVFHNELPIYLVLTLAAADKEPDLVITLMQQQDRVSFDIRVSGSGWEECFCVSKSNTVYDVKKMIEKAADIKLNQQILFHKSNMARLDDDDKTLGFYALKEGSELYVFGLSPKFSLKMPQVRDTVSINAIGIKYVSDIKDGIFEKLGIPHSSQNLVYQGQLLDDSQIPEAYEIEGNSLVYAVIGYDDHQTKELCLDIMISGVVYCDIKVKQWYKILDVKTIIESKTGVPIGVQELLDHQHQQLKDWKHLSEYNLKNLDKVYLELRGSPVNLIINVPGRKNKHNIVIEAETTDTLDEILRLIPEEEMEKIDGQPCLFHNNNPLLGNQMLAQYGITLSKCRLCLDKLVQINVTGADGITRKVNLRPRCDIKTVKQEIEQICGIPYEVQRLRHLDDDELECEAEDKQTLAHYEATLGSLWDLRWKFAGRSWSFFWPSYRGNMLTCEEE